MDRQQRFCSILICSLGVGWKCPFRFKIVLHVDYQKHEQEFEVDGQEDELVSESPLMQTVANEVYATSTVFPEASLVPIITPSIMETPAIATPGAGEIPTPFATSTPENKIISMRIRKKDLKLLPNMKQTG